MDLPNPMGDLHLHTHTQIMVPMLLSQTATKILNLEPAHCYILHLSDIYKNTGIIVGINTDFVLEVTKGMQKQFLYHSYYHILVI